MRLSIVIYAFMLAHTVHPILRMFVDSGVVNGAAAQQEVLRI